MVKKILILVLAIALKINAQVNLVPNPSFESFTSCPIQSGDIDKATGWTSFCGSPDYFNKCNQFDWGVPKNIFGFQQPASGSGYAGFGTWSNVMANTREFPSCILINPLNIGTKYFISFKVALSLENLANPTNCASDKTGMKFTLGSSTCNSLINNNPHVFTNSIITDSLNWTRISGSFVADLPYTTAVIGNFFDDANINTTKFFNSWWSDFAYYYLDDVCVSTDSIFANNYNYTGIEQYRVGEEIGCYPNPIIDVLKIENPTNKRMNIEIYNLLGEQVYTILDSVNKVLLVDLKNCASGILFVSIKSGGQITKYKFIKL